MPTASRTFTFESDLEGWVAFPHADSTMVRTTAEGHADDAALQTYTSGMNNGGASYWEWTGTWEDLGVPAGSTVQQVNGLGGFFWRCYVYFVGHNNTGVGPLELRDAGGSLIGTLSVEAPGITGTTDWALIGSTAVSVPDHASDTTVRLRLNVQARTGNNNSAEVGVRQDSIEIVSTYEGVAEPPAQVTGLAVATPKYFKGSLTWNAADGADSYEIERDGAVKGSTDALAFTDRGLTSETLHEWRVRGVNAAGPGPWSDPVQETTPAIPTYASLGDAIVDAEPRMHLPLSETAGGTVASSVGGHTGTVGAGVTLDTEGVDGSGAAFDGVNVNPHHMIAMGQHADFLTDHLQGMSIYHWNRRCDPETASNPTTIGIRTSSTGSTYNVFLGKNGNIIRANFNGGDGGTVHDSSDRVIGDLTGDTWHQIVSTHDGSTMRLWYDDDNVWTLGGTWVANGVLSTPMDVGCRAQFNAYTGDMDEPAVFGYVLTGEQILLLHGLAFPMAVQGTQRLVLGQQAMFSAPVLEGAGTQRLVLGQQATVGAEATSGAGAQRVLLGQAGTGERAPITTLGTQRLVLGQASAGERQAQAVSVAQRLVLGQRATVGAEATTADGAQRLVAGQAGTGAQAAQAVAGTQRLVTGQAALARAEGMVTGTQRLVLGQIASATRADSVGQAAQRLVVHQTGAGVRGAGVGQGAQTLILGQSAAAARAATSVQAAQRVLLAQTATGQVGGAMVLAAAQRLVLGQAGDGARDVGSGQAAQSLTLNQAGVGQVGSGGMVAAAQRLVLGQTATGERADGSSQAAQRVVASQAGAGHATSSATGAQRVVIAQRGTLTTPGTSAQGTQRLLLGQVALSAAATHGAAAQRLVVGQQAESQIGAGAFSSAAQRLVLGQAAVGARAPAEGAATTRLVIVQRAAASGAGIAGQGTQRLLVGQAVQAAARVEGVGLQHLIAEQEATARGQLAGLGAQAVVLRGSATLTSPVAVAGAGRLILASAGSGFVGVPPPAVEPSMTGVSGLWRSTVGVPGRVR